MRRSILTILLAQVWLLSIAQPQERTGQTAARIEALKANGASFVQMDLVKAGPTDPHTRALWAGECKRATAVYMNKAVVARMMERTPPYITVTLPTPDGPVALELEQWQPLADGFTVTSASKGVVTVAPGVHYRGRVQGDNRSVAGLSIFGDELMATVSNAHGTLVLGRLKHAETGVHVAYWDRDLVKPITFTCGTEYTGGAIHPGELQEAGERSMRCVKFHWEADYPIFQNKGSITAVTNYLTGLFNQSAILFGNDGVDVQLQEVYVWDSASPYSGPTTQNFLSQFGQHRTSFNGDLAHLLGYSGGGGIAWLNTLCANTSSRMAYSDINSTFSNVPTYSWSVNVVTHEQGHNLGSPHTHDCAWNGSGTAIDGCGPTAGYTTGCPVAPLPSNGGTIMSYCHLVSGVGINFNHGFGPQPAALIRNRVNAATCLAQCGSTCDPPGPISVSSLTSISASLNWPDVGAASYTLRWKPQAAGTWTVVPGLVVFSYGINGLTQNTAYEFQVLSDCGSASSAYGDTLAFTTPLPCQDTLEPNNTVATAAAVILPASISALVATDADADHYGFNIPATSNILVNMSGLPADYDVRLLNSTGTQLASSENAGTSGEYLSYNNAPAGNYVVHVYGFGGAFNPVACYSLYINAYALMCPWPQSTSATDITYNSATLHWTLVQGAMQYDVRWKESVAPAWTVVAGISGTTYLLNGLASGTAHQFQVRSVCQGEGTTQFPTSEWTEPRPFTTLALPCELAPPITLAAKVLLGGAWRSGQGLMVDSLRKQGVMPLTEPFTALGHAITGATTTTAAVLAVTGNNAIVDWVLVELRSATTPSQILESHAALVQRDGDIVAVDGSSPVGFCQNSGSYYVAVRHRNHLGVMTAQSVVLGATAISLDFSLPATATWGADARQLVDGRAMLWSGNVVHDAVVKYTGTGNDRDAILALIGGSVPTATVAGYHAEDVTMDGTVKYTGAGNDRDPILGNLGALGGTGTIAEQLP